MSIPGSVLPARAGLSLVEVLVALLILVIAGIPLYNVVGTGTRGVERSRDHMIAFTIAEKIVEKITNLMHGTPADRQIAINLVTTSPQPLSALPFYSEIKDSLTADIAPAADQSGDASWELQHFMFTVDSTVETPALSPEPVCLAKKVRVFWKDDHNKDRSIELDSSFSNTSIYYDVVKANYANAKSITDLMMQQIMAQSNLALVTMNGLGALQAPMASNGYLDSDPWYDGYMAQAPGLTINRRLGTAGQTSDERMAVKEAALAQFLNLPADQASVLTYDLKNEAEAVVKQLQNLPPYSDTFKNVTGAPGLGVRSPGVPGAYTCLNCHSPQFFASQPEGYLSIPAGFMTYVPQGETKTGAQWLQDYLDALSNNKAISPDLYTTYTANLKRSDVGKFSGATSL